MWAPGAAMGSRNARSQVLRGSPLARRGYQQVTRAGLVQRANGGVMYSPEMGRQCALGWGKNVGLWTQRLLYLGFSLAMPLSTCNL